jgi:outer membrane protein assembly factor BamB
MISARPLGRGALALATVWTLLLILAVPARATLKTAPGGKLPAFSAETGRTLWTKGTDGDIQGLALLNGKVYAGIGCAFTKESGVSQFHFAQFSSTS